MNAKKLSNIKLLKGDTNNYLPKELKIESVKKMTEDTSLFRLKNTLNEIPLPGEFVEASIFGIGESPISICNYESTHIELLIRNVGNVTNKLFNLKQKEKMLIRGPYGTGYPMNELKNKDLVIIAGGTGIAPPRSVIQYLLKNKKKYKNVSIFLGFRSFKDILFHEEINEWKKHFKVYITIDQKDKNWNGDVGVITNLLDKYKIPKKPKFVLCGPPIMIKFVIKNLIAKKYSDSDMYISFERNMKCGIGKCGHCMIHGKYVCTDGPVFRYDLSKSFTE